MVSHTDRARDIYRRYTRDLSAEDLQRLFTHDTLDAYRFFTRGIDQDTIAHLPWWKQAGIRARQIFTAFTEKLPAARRALSMPSSIPSAA